MTTLERAIETYGEDMQLNVAIEEFSELTKEICKFNRGSDNIDNLIEEMADCYIMLEQLKIIFEIEDSSMYAMVNQKLKRLRNRLDAEMIKDAPPLRLEEISQADYYALEVKEPNVMYIIKDKGWERGIWNLTENRL